MKLIKKLDTRRVNDQMKRFCLFFCPACNNIIEKEYQHGLRQKTCGCKRHGLFGTNEYKLWAGIKRRCYNPNEKNYNNYGGRGIKICDIWRENPSEFKKWCDKNGYKKGLIIDRVDPDGDYSPDNCRFVNELESGRNKRSVKLTLEEARRVRKLYKFGIYTQKDLDKIFELPKCYAGKIIREEVWREDG